MKYQEEHDQVRNAFQALVDAVEALSQVAEQDDIKTTIMAVKLEGIDQENSGLDALVFMSEAQMAGTFHSLFEKHPEAVPAARFALAKHAVDKAGGPEAALAEMLSKLMK